MKRPALCYFEILHDVLFLSPSTVVYILEVITSWSTQLLCINTGYVFMCIYLYFIHSLAPTLTRKYTITANQSNAMYMQAYFNLFCI